MDVYAKADEIHFWGHQLMEHALFLHLGIVDDHLKTKGLLLHERWKLFMDYAFPGIEEHKIELDEGDRMSINFEILSEVFELIADTEKYKLEILSRLEAGDWIGWIFPLFVRHLLRELYFFRDKLLGDVTIEQEARFWNLINGEHAGFAAHLLDPNPDNWNLIDQSEETYRKLALLSQYEGDVEMLQYITLSLTEWKKLDEFSTSLYDSIAANTVKSVIHPKLLRHDIREGKRATLMMERLL